MKLFSEAYLKSNHYAANIFQGNHLLLGMMQKTFFEKRNIIDVGQAIRAYRQILCENVMGMK